MVEKEKDFYIKISSKVLQQIFNQSHNHYSDYETVEYRVVKEGDEVFVYQDSLWKSECRVKTIKTVIKLELIK